MIYITSGTKRYGRRADVVQVRGNFEVRSFVLTTVANRDIKDKIPNHQSYLIATTYIVAHIYNYEFYH
jgi:hypothetical protein